MIPPVLLVVFKRPDTTSKVFEAIRSAKPQDLFVAADGPRETRSGEAELCAQARKIATAVDWPCRMRTFFRESNVGAGRNVSEAITWMLGEVDRGIILEDDCLPSGEFFGFAGELLKLYENDRRVMHISGSCFQPRKRGDASYFFSKYNHGWGWATWKRAWEHFDFKLNSLEGFLNQADESGFWESPRCGKYWKKVFKETKLGKVDAWDYQWKLTLWRQGGLAIYPNVNLISNLGFNDNGTNTLTFETGKAERHLETLGPITHPQAFFPHRQADRWTFNHMYWGTFLSRLRARLRKYFRWRFS